MADQSALIKPGPAILITSGLQGGATVYNHDTTSAVWIGVTPDVAPGNGSKVGALGSVVWSQTGPIYAVVDTGVSSPVSVTLSTSTTNPVDPVAVGSAVAAQLLATGVPNVLIGKGFDGTAATGTPALSNTPPYLDVSAYASVTYSVTVTSVSGANGGCIIYGFYDPVSGLDYGTRRFIVTDSRTVTFSAPVKGQYLWVALINLTANAFFCYGSNRVLSETISNISTGGNYGLTQAYTSGTSVKFPGSLVTNGGLHQIRWVLTGSATGLLQVSSWDDTAGNNTYFVVLDSKDGHASPGGSTLTEVHQTVILPPGVLNIQFYPYTTGTYQSLCQITPTS